MKFVKILFVAIFVWCIGNAESTEQNQTQAQPQTIFDLPDNTPGLQKNRNGTLKTQQKTVCGQLEDCVHVIVPGSNADKRRMVFKHSIELAMQVNGNIYFPANGSQPTTEEVVEYSCANVNDNTITDWYIKAFGGDHAIKYSKGKNPTGTDNAPKMGFVPVKNKLTARPSAKTIITTHPNMSNGTRIADFWTDFREIASNREGRILLYRLLIEIRRYKSGKACVCNDITDSISNNLLWARANCRNIMIIWEDSGNSFSKANTSVAPDGNAHNESTKLPSGGFALSSDNIVYPFAIIKFSKHNRKLTTICQENNDNQPISLFERESSIGLFHEMVHWFHVLRHPQRHSEERIGFKNAGGAISLCDTSQRETIGAYFWGNFSDDSDHWKISAYPWIGRSIDNTYVNFEEIRTILGAPTLEQYRAVVTDTSHLNPYVFLNGDDLSENKYRASLNAKLRFGHSNQPFYEDKTVIRRVMTISRATESNIIDLTCYNNLDNGYKPECKIGLGNFHVGGYNIGSMIP